MSEMWPRFYSFFSPQIRNNMIISLSISDDAYKRLIKTGSRIQGTIGLVNPCEGNFNEHVRHTPCTGTKYLKLRHGRATVGNTQVRLTLNIGLDETDIMPSCAIIDESRQASDFVDSVIDNY